MQYDEHINMPTLDKKLTKIVATLGPASEDEKIIEELIRAGVNVFRFNTKHSSPEWHEKRIDRVQKVADRLKMSIGILIDLQGPELRIHTKDGQPVQVAKGDLITIHSTLEQEGATLAIPHKLIFDTLKKGDQLLIDDGYIEAIVESTTDSSLELRLINSGIIKHKKGVNLPGTNLDLPSLIHEDLEQLDMASINKVDFVALSFARTKSDIAILKDEMLKRGMQAHVVAKIESRPALDHLDELIEVSDSIMVARGDLGVEVPIEELAFWQKEIIRRCRLANKPVITATEMLESMVENSRPTRAEATDVANAVLDGSDAVMLSAETAIGKYPVRTVEFMSRITKFNESKIDLYKIMLDNKPTDRTEQVTSAAVTMISNQTDVPIDAVLIFTETGYTARTFATYRLNIPVICVTDSRKTVETMTLTYGVHPYYVEFPEGSFIDPDKMIEKLKEMDVVQVGQLILVIHGRHWRVPGLTNSLTLVKA